MLRSGDCAYIVGCAWGGHHLQRKKKRIFTTSIYTQSTYRCHVVRVGLLKIGGTIFLVVCILVGHVPHDCTKRRTEWCTHFLHSRVPQIKHQNLNMLILVFTEVTPGFPRTFNIPQSTTQDSMLEFGWVAFALLG